MKRKGWPVPESFRCALQGMVETVLGERNMRIHISVAAPVLYGAYHLRLSITEWCFLVLAIGMVFAGEVFNTAIEHTVDAKVNEYQEMAKKAKDAAAGGVLVLAMMAVVIGMLIFLPNGRLQTLTMLCVSSKLRITALVIYVLIAIWFIFSDKKQMKRRR